MLTKIAALALAAASPFVPPLGPRAPVEGVRTQMLNVGSPHLAEVPVIKPAMLEPLIADLVRFRPSIITVESVAGEQCDMMHRAPYRYKDSWETYCTDPTAAQKATGLTQQQAEAESEKLFDRWSRPEAAAPSAADRRKAALILLAANERYSAYAQWLRLAPADRIAADGLDAGMVKVLNREGKPLNEAYHVAAVLAARLGIDRIYMVDDHSSDGANLHAGKAYEDAMRARFARYQALPLAAQDKKRAAAVHDGPSLLAFYRHLNDPAWLKPQIEADFGGALSDKAAAPYGRQYAAWWEVRNLRMAANIRAATVEHPGARVLNIVGSSHKPWYDTWMRQMSDVEVVPVAPYLR